MLWPFLLSIGSPDRVTPAHVLGWAYGIAPSGREPSSATIGARIGCLSSYYRFLIRMQVATANPCDALERPKSVQAVARGLNAEEVRRLLAVVPDTVAGRRDRALLLLFVLTGRRRSEVINLVAGDISVEGEIAFYRHRGKGDKTGRRELPRPAHEALGATLRDTGSSSPTWTRAPHSGRPGPGHEASHPRPSTAASHGICAWPARPRAGPHPAPLRSEAPPRVWTSRCPRRSSSKAR